MQLHRIFVETFRGIRTTLLRLMLVAQFHVLAFVFFSGLCL